MPAMPNKGLNMKKINYTITIITNFIIGMCINRLWINEDKMFSVMLFISWISYVAWDIYVFSYLTKD